MNRIEKKGSSDRQVFPGIRWPNVLLLLARLQKSFERDPQSYLDEIGMGEACGVDLPPP
jgi:hypothetical protein